MNCLDKDSVKQQVMYQLRCHQSPALVAMILHLSYTYVCQVQKELSVEKEIN
ncbi:hypothetical protein [Cysteiniphilum halobium]|uniref:hypothetical protein n=1 Tax=Cysteiniphilum halobium TaxID=2219059 RepID=UPI0013C300C9|nr:hypothetical protein [Cysteiniphilum halobium]